VRVRSRRRNVVVWSSSWSSSSSSAFSGRTARPGVQVARRPGRIRWWLRTGALLAIIGVLRLAGIARRHLRPAISLAGAAVTLAGITLPSGPVLSSGFLILLLALFMPSDLASAPAGFCSGRLWAAPLTPKARHLPPSN
jgi:hypothetical protein